MARKKTQPAQNADNLEQAQTELPPAEAAGSNQSPNPDAPAAETLPPDEEMPTGKAAWKSRVIGGGWTDAEAGVHLVEDHRNRRMTITFDEKPPEDVRKLMKEEYGYRFDGENQLWYKSVNPATPRQHREEAEHLAFEAANLIRQERGLAQKESFLLGM